MSTVEQSLFHALPTIDIPPFGRGIPIRMPTTPFFLSHLLQGRNPEAVSLPPLLTPFAAFLEYEESGASRAIKQVQTSYIDLYRRGVRQYDWDSVISYLHADQFGTRLPDVVASLYEGIGDVLGAYGHQMFTSHGGERRRLELRDIVHRDIEHPHILRVFARDLLAVPTGGDPSSFYERCAHSIVSRLVHPYNKDLKVPLPVCALPTIGHAVEKRIVLTLEALQTKFSVQRVGDNVTIYIPDWRTFWSAPRIRAEIPVNVPRLEWGEKFLIMYPKLHCVAGYVISVCEHHRPDGNSRWQALYLQGGIVDPRGEFIHLNLEAFISPEATKVNQLAEVDERSGSRVTSYQRQGVIFDTKTRTVTLPTHDSYRFSDALPDPLPRDIDKLLGLLNRQVQYYALTVEQNDKRQLTLNARKLVRMIERLRGCQSISPEKAEQAIQTMALAFLQAPNALVEFFRVSGLSTVFPKAVRLDMKVRMSSLDRLDMCFPTTEVDPQTGMLNWTLQELGIYLAIIHASGDPFPTRTTKRSLMAEFCYLFDPRT